MDYGCNTEKIKGGGKARWKSLKEEAKQGERMGREKKNLRSGIAEVEVWTGSNQQDI